MFSDAAEMMVECRDSVKRSEPVDVARKFEIDGITTFVRTGNFRRVSLQFPDYLLGHSVLVVEALRRSMSDLTISFFVLADTTFGSCCADEVTAMHCNADCIVHFGYACLSRTVRLPVYYVHDKTHFDIIDSLSALRDVLSETSESLNRLDCELNAQIVIFFSSAFGETQVDEFLAGVSDDFLSDKRIQVCCTSTRGVVDIKSGAPMEIQQDLQFKINGIVVPRLVDHGTIQRILYIGDTNSPHLPQLFLVEKYYEANASDASTKFFVALQHASRALVGTTLVVRLALLPSVVRTSRMVDQRLRQRMYNIEVAKTATSFGIVVASLAIEGYLALVSRLKDVVKASASPSVPRRAYVIYMGHLNQYKVANFVDSIDCFVAISCPNSRECQFPQKDDAFLKPVLTPVELLIALGVCDFNDPNSFSSDFLSLMHLCSFALRNRPDRAERTECDGTLTSTRGGALVLASASALQRLHEREYVGLTTLVGQTEVQDSIMPGLRGIAKGYETES